MDSLVCLLLVLFCLVLQVPRTNGFAGTISFDDREEHPLGPPRLLDELAESCQSLCRQDAFGSQVAYDVERISATPHMFVLRNFVSQAECYTLQWSSRNDPKEAFSYRGSAAANRNGSFVCWLQPNAANGISRSLARSAASIVFSREMRSGKDGSGLYEQMQLVRYDTDGQFDLHHDADKYGRVVTVLYYLNGVAGTWFPLASGPAQAGQPTLPSIRLWLSSTSAFRGIAL